MNPADFEGVPLNKVECRCNECNAVNAPFFLRAVMVADPKRPQNQVPAIQMLATKEPPYKKAEDGTVQPNPAYDPMQTVPVATWVIVEEFCSQDCFHNIMDRMWRLAQSKVKVLWGQ